MPKETVATRGTFDVQVGWATERGVQVGIIDSDGASLFWQLIGATVRATDDPEWHDAQVNRQREILAELGSSCRVAAKAGKDDAEIGELVLNRLDTMAGLYDSVWVEVERPEINLLIRLLRKARDAAYGRDE